ncbi:hypothetical protein OBBRIDRAFT_788859 [Obba rivulosa]|uniref:Uncharacterized protein n=1 Tax=Obba rivulosa TaxID=1052685 RepID=A0A8E2DSL3_9APHY|nr:hypothetical protein OBBRIDRAFT_788859 [Obba rivulosa]
MSSRFDTACQYIDLTADAATLVGPAGPAIIRIVDEFLPGTAKKRGDQYMSGTLNLLEKHALRIPRNTHILLHEQYDKATSEAELQNTIQGCSMFQISTGRKNMEGRGERALPRYPKIIPRSP